MTKNPHTYGQNTYKIRWAPTGKSSAFSFSHEKGNHLGNVLAVISDQWKTACMVSGDPGEYVYTFLHYEATVIQQTDYSAFGAPLPGRTWYESACSSKYKYGFNGQEKEDDAAGADNVYSAEYWMYDGRLGRRFETDPILKTWESPYSCLGDNPILNIDVLGNDWFQYQGKDDKKAEWHWHDGSTYKLQTGIDVQGKPTYQELSGEKSVVDFKGSINEKLGPNGSITEPGAIAAEVTLYAADGTIHKYTGFSMTSSDKDFTAIESGIYTLNLSGNTFDVGNGYRINKKWAVNNRGHVKTKNGVRNENPGFRDQREADGTPWKDGIFLHNTCNSDRATGTTSTGCLLIANSQWADFDKNMSLNSAGKTKLILTREGSTHNPVMNAPKEYNPPPPPPQQFNPLPHLPWQRDDGQNPPWGSPSPSPVGQPSTS